VNKLPKRLAGRADPSERGSNGVKQQRVGTVAYCCQRLAGLLGVAEGVRQAASPRGNLVVEGRD
jgi:hypothetical protein